LDSPNVGDMDIGPELRGAMHAALRQARDSNGWTRDRVVDRMNLALPELQKAITKRQLDSWMAESKEFHEFPLRYAAAFCWATGSAEPARVLIKTLGFDLVDARDVAALELGEAQVGIARLRRKAAVLTKTLGA
jgi:hypothetical protein